MPVYETTGVVLQGMDLGEKDRLITFYCRDEGLIRLAVSGAKDFQRGKTGLLQKFCWHNIEYYQKNTGESLGSINNLSLRNLFSSLRRDIKSFSYGNYVLEFYKKTGTGQTDPKYFKHLINILTLLEAAEADKEFKILHAIFRLRALDLLGFKPEIESCIDCGSSPAVDDFQQGDRVILSLKKGAIFCCRQDNPARGKFPLDKLTYKMLETFLHQGFKAVQGEYNKFDEERIDYLNKIIEKFINYHLDLSLNSNRFLPLY